MLKFMMLRRAGGFFVLQSSIFRISEKLLNGEQGHALTKKRHLSLNIKDGCLFRLCSIKFTGQEINLLLQEPDLLFQFCDLILVLQFPV